MEHEILTDPNQSLLPSHRTPDLHASQASITSLKSHFQRQVSQLQCNLSHLQQQVSTLTQIASLDESQFHRVFHLASVHPRFALRAVLAYTTHPTPLFETARTALTGPVGRIGHRRLLRALAILLLDEIIARHPDHTDAMCLKGEALLPHIHYGQNDSRAPRSVLQEAYDLFENAAKLGSNLGLFLKGRWLLSMQPLHKDAARAEVGSECVKKAAEANCSRALVFLAHRYEYPELDLTVSFSADLPKSKSQRERFILSFYQRAAEMGDPDALNDIGTSYAEGYGSLECNFDKAVDYYVRAIDKGSLHAYDNLGTHYETGMGNRFPDRIDFEKALYYYREGARQRCPKCAYNLAAAHEEGMAGALPRNSRLAEKYYRHAIKLADDANDIITISKCFKDLIALYITRIKLNTPNSDVCAWAKKQLLDLITDQAMTDRTVARVNRAISAPARSRGTAIAKLLGDINSKLIVQQIKELEPKIRSHEATGDQTIKYHHILGTEPPEPASAEIEPSETNRSKRPRRSNSGHPVRKRARKKW